MKVSRKSPFRRIAAAISRGRHALVAWHDSDEQLLHSLRTAVAQASPPGHGQFTRHPYHFP
jgi:hypothetical protein